MRRVRARGLFQASMLGWTILVAMWGVTGVGLRGELIPVEVMYNHPDDDELEFIEFENQGAARLDLDGAQFTNGITFTFERIVLEPGERFILAKNQFEFESAYPESMGTIVGDYDGQLSNKGEKLVLIAFNGAVLLDFEYSDGGGWPGRADGGGSSLQLEEGETDINSSGSWDASERYGGAPGGMERFSGVNVVINEVLTHTDAPFQDAIELKNTGSEPVDLSGWLLSDNDDELDRYVIPDGVVISPNGYAVFYEQAINFENTRIPFSLSSAMGDKVILTSANASGLPLFFIDDVTFDAAANGFPFGRFPDGEGRFITLERQTLGTDILPSDLPGQLDTFIRGEGAPNAGPLVGPLVISRIMYDPPSGKAEFVELSNLTPFELPLFDPLASTNRWRISGAVSFEFPQDTRVPPNGSVIVANTLPDLFTAQYPDLSPDGLFGPYLGSLNNGGERIKVFRPDFPVQAPHPDAGFVPYFLAEEVEYDDDAPWPVLNDELGEFLVKRDLMAYGDDPSNWMSSMGSAAGMADEDQDGIVDEWERANGLDPSDASDAVEDFDGDGASNRAEYVAATDPNNASDSLRMRSVVIEGSELVFTFDARAGVEYDIVLRDSIDGGEGQIVDSLSVSESREAVHRIQVIGGGTQFVQLLARRAP